MNRRNDQQGRLAACRRRLTILLLLAIMLIAALLRFWQLGGLPPGLYHDEAYNGLDALALLEGQTFPNHYEGWELYAADAHAERAASESEHPIFFEGNYGREPLHVYLMALSIQIFGPSPFALRAVPATAGVLAVLTTFLASQALLGSIPWIGNTASQKAGRRSFQKLTWQQAVSLLAALTVAIFYPAITFSRFGIRAMLFVPFETLAVACFWQGVGRGFAANQPETRADRQAGQAWAWYLLAGLFLGLGVYTYAAARLLPLLFVIFVPLWFWLEPTARREWRRILLMGVSALLVAMPLLLFFARYPYFFVFRTSFVANKGLGTYPGRPWLTWLNNVGRVIRGLFWQGETHLRHNLPGRPYLDPIQAVLFVMGAIAALRTRSSPRKWRGLFLLIWLAVMLLPTVLSGDAPHFGRMTGAVPPVAILIALGAAWLWRLIVARVDRADRDGRRLATLVIAFGFLLSAGLSVADYFGRYADHPDLAEDFYLDDWQLGQLAAGEPDDTALYLSPTQEEMATIYFALGGDVERLSDYNGAAGAVPAGMPGRPSLYLLRPEETGALQRLKDYFPDGESGEIAHNAVPFRVPANAPRLPGANPTDLAFQEQDGDALALIDWLAFFEEDALTMTLYWQASGAVSQQWTAFVHVLDEQGSLIAQLDRQPAGHPTQDWREGEIVADQFVVPLPADLASGTYFLETGFYHSASRLPLGEPVRLGRISFQGGE